MDVMNLAEVTQYCLNNKQKYPQVNKLLKNYLRAIFFRIRQIWQIWNSDGFKNPLYLHMLFLLWSIWIAKIFLQFWWLVPKLWLIKVWGCFQQKVIFGWKSKFDMQIIFREANIGANVFFPNIDISWKYITKNEKHLCAHVGFSL